MKTWKHDLVQYNYRSVKQKTNPESEYLQAVSQDWLQTGENAANQQAAGGSVSQTSQPLLRDVHQKPWLELPGLSPASRLSVPPRNNELCPKGGAVTGRPGNVPALEGSAPLSGRMWGRGWTDKKRSNCKW